MGNDLSIWIRSGSVHHRRVAVRFQPSVHQRYDTVNDRVTYAFLRRDELYEFIIPLYVLRTVGGIVVHDQDRLPCID
jgi:hypothetical protein